MVLIATKSKQLGVRLEQPQIERLDEIAERYQHTQAGLVRLAVDQLIQAFEVDGQLPISREHTDIPEAAAAAGAGR